MNSNTSKTHSTLQAAAVVIIWATSWVMTKVGLEEIPPFTFAGLRYFLAFMVLLPPGLRKTHLAEIRQFTRTDWINLALLGLFYYSINQGAIYAALAYLPAVSVSLVISFTSIFTAWLAGRSLDENLSPLQWLGLILNLLGAYLYFHPVRVLPEKLIGLLFAFAAMIGNSLGTVLGRKVNLSNRISPLTITLISMGIGSIGLLGWGLASEPFPSFSIRSLSLLLILVFVNTAFAFYLWNKALKGLRASEASIINNTIIIPIALLAWIFLGEELTGLDIVGIILSAAGALVVQLPNRQNGISPASRAR